MPKISWNEIVNKGYIVIENKVYDVTNFKDHHPGGSFIFEDWYGKDASEIFNSTGHSDHARELMKEFCVGELDRESKRTASVHSPVLWYSIMAGVISAVFALIIIMYK